MATFTYQTLIPCSGAVERALSEYARVFGLCERRLFALIAPKKDPVVPKPEAAKLKPRFCRDNKITSRQFNAVCFQVEGMIAGVQRQQAGLIVEMRARIRKAETVVKKLSEPPKTPVGRRRRRFRPHKRPQAEARRQKKARLAKLHQKRRRLEALKRKLEAMEADHGKGIVRIAFGTRRLFQAQFGETYESHDAWYQDWQKARSGQFFVLGSKDETAGCQGCVATINEDDESLDLRVRLPDAVAEDPSIETVDKKYVVLKGVKFAHGHDEVLQALQRSKLSVVDGKSKKRAGVALSWRFLRDEKHGEPVWYIHVTVDVTAPPIVTRRDTGAFGVDFNGDHLALAELDRFGNLIDHERIPTNLSYKSSGQRDAILGDAVTHVVEQAAAAGKPLVIEELDFSEKKAQLEDVDRRRARMLSALAYSKFHRLIKAAAFRAGVEVIEVDPAFTSVIGAINYAQILGVSIHIAAALVIARRGMNMTERLRPSVLREGARVPVRNGGYCTLSLLDDSDEHVVPPNWSDVTGKLRAALQAHYQSGKCTHDPAPMSPRRAARGMWQHAPAPQPGRAASATW